MTILTDALPDLLPPRGYVAGSAAPPLTSEPLSADFPDSTGVLPGAPPLERAARLLDLAVAARMRMRTPRAHAFASAAASIARELGDAVLALLAEREMAACSVLSHPALSAGAAVTDAAGREDAHLLVSRAVAAALAGDTGAALATLGRAARAAGGRDAYARLLVSINVALVTADRGDLSAASREAASALRAARREKSDHGEALAGLASALVHLARGRRGDARQQLGESARLFARHGDALRQIQCHYLLGEVAYIGEDPIRAGSHYRDGLGIAREVAAQEWIELLTLRFEHR